MMDLPSVTNKEYEDSGDDTTMEDEEEQRGNIHPMDAVNVELSFEDDSRNMSFKENIEKFLKTSASDDIFRCCFCNRQFVKKYMLKRHLTVHMENRPSFSCKYCGKCYAWMVSLQRHMKKCRKTAGNDAQYKCSTCSKIFNQKVHHTEHQRICTAQGVAAEAASPAKNKDPDDTNESAPESDIKVEILECGTCSKKFKNKEFFEKHQGIHAILQTPHTCNMCGNTYKQRTSLVRHQLYCDVVDNDNTDEPPTLDAPKVPEVKAVEEKTIAPKRPFVCDNCGNTYQLRHSMNRHRRVCKQMSNASMYTCSICANKFQDKITLAQHWRACRGRMTQNTKENKGKIMKGIKIRAPSKSAGSFPCEKCGSMYIWKSNLRRHQRKCMKSSVLKFFCQKCGSQFNGQSSLEKHTKICTKSEDTNAVSTESHVKVDETNIDSNQLAEQKTRKFGHACRICGNVYKHSGSKFRHERVCRTKSSKPKLACSGCGNKFHEQHILEQHQIKCSLFARKNAKQIPPKDGKKNEGVFPCENCGKTYALTSSLRRHQRKCKPKPNAQLSNTADISENQTHSMTDCSEAKPSTASEIQNDTKTLQIKPEKDSIDTEGASKSFKCDNCGNSYMHNNSLIRHQSRCHVLERRPKISCQGCLNKFHDQYSLAQHKKTCRGKAQLVSNIKIRILQKKRIESKMRKDTYACGKCGNIYKHNFTRNRHQRKCEKEIGAPQFPCDICGNKYYKEDSFIGHRSKCIKQKQTSLPEKSFKAHDMQKQPVTPENLEKTNEAKALGFPFSCKYCGIAYKHNSSVYRHQISCKEKPGSSTVSCHTCGNRFQTEESLMNHVQTCSIGAEVLDSAPDVEEMSYEDLKVPNTSTATKKPTNDVQIQKLGETMRISPQYVCIICENTFDGKISFDAHIDNCRKLFWDTQDESSDESDVEPETPTKIFECSICPKSFTSKTGMMDHAVTHMKNKPVHTCQNCGRVFAWKRNLNIHMDICKTLEKSSSSSEDITPKKTTNLTSTPKVQEMFKCSMCPRTFKLTHHLKQHQQSHNKEKKTSFDCQTCGNKYRHSRSLHRHQQKSCKATSVNSSVSDLQSFSTKAEGAASDPEEFDDSEDLFEPETRDESGSTKFAIMKRRMQK